jgi:hypothetical protein
MREARSALHHRLLPLAAAVLALSALHPETADASSTDECVDANTKGQLLRRSGKLNEARDQFELCSERSCPALVSADCITRRAELEQIQPTVIFEIEDGKGEDLAGVSVRVDDKPLTNAADGTELRVNPGEHVFTFRSPGAVPQARTFVIAEGVRGRHERVVLLPLAPRGPPAPVAAVEPTHVANGPTPTQSPGLRAPMVLALVAAGTSLVAVATGGIFGALTNDAWTHQRADCSSPASCPDHAAALADHDHAVFDGTVANVAFASGGALFALAAVLFFSGRTGPKGNAFVVAPSVLAGAPGLQAGGRF